MDFVTSFRRTVTLAAGLNNCSTLVQTALGSTQLVGGVIELTHRVEAGGPVAKGDSTMAAITDGASYDVKEGDTERASMGNAIHLGAIYFFATNAGDKLYLQIRCR